MSRFVFPSLLIIIAIAAFFVYVRPTYSETQGVIAQIEQYDATLEKARQVRDLLDGLITRYNSISSEELERLEKLIPRNVDNVRLIIEIEAIAQLHDIDLESVLVTEIGQNSGNNNEGGEFSIIPKLNTVGVQINVIADYETFKLFMSDLEANLRIVDLNTVTFTTQQNDEGEDVTSYAIALQTYWLE